MHRLNGTEDGYSFRKPVTRQILDAKASMIQLHKYMQREGFVLPVEETKLLAHADAAIDELLHVYHGIVLEIDANKNT